jgi:hypothetical protein
MRRTVPSHHIVVLACLGSALAGCGGDTTGALHSSGRIAVTVATLGGGAGLTGYAVSLDASDLRPIGREGSVLYEGVEEGEHHLTLSGIPTTCALEGNNPRRVTVDGGLTSNVRFSLFCDPPLIGGFQIEVTTTGASPDANGYQLSVEGATARNIAINASELFLDLASGRHLIELRDVASHCQVVGENPKTFTVLPGKTVRVRLMVTC